MKIINPEVNVQIEQRGVIRINLGAGQSAVAGFYNLDMIMLPGTDIVANLNENLGLFPDNSVDEIYSRASLEHVSNLIGLMEEIHRICKPNAIISIIVPHFSNAYYYSDPTHVRPFALYTMHYFMDEIDQKGRKVPSYYTSARFTLKCMQIQFYRERLVDKVLEPVISWFVNMSIGSQDVYERRLCYFFPAWQMQYMLINKK